MYAGYGCQMQSAVFVLILHVAESLEVVGIEFAFLQSGIRSYVVVEFNDFECPAILGQLVSYDVLQNFCMWNQRGSYLDDLFILLAAIAAAGCQCK